MSGLPAPCGSSVFHRREFGPSQPYSRELLSPNYKCVPPPSLSEGGFLVVELKTCHSLLIVAGEGIR